MRTRLLANNLMKIRWKLSVLTVPFRYGFAEGLRIWREFCKIRNSKHFKGNYYLKEKPDLVTSGEHPLIHYVVRGAREGRNPNNYFDSNAYIEAHKDVDFSKISPLLHALQAGGGELKWQKPAQKNADKPATLNGKTPQKPSFYSDNNHSDNHLQKNILNLAREAEDAYEIERAITLYETIITSSKAEMASIALQWLGILHDERGDTDQASAAYALVNSLTPEYGYWFGRLTRPIPHRYTQRAFIIDSSVVPNAINCYIFQGETVLLLDDAFRVWSNVDFVPTYIYLHDDYLGRNDMAQTLLERIHAEEYVHIVSTDNSVVYCQDVHLVPTYLIDCPISSACAFLVSEGFDDIIVVSGSLPTVDHNNTAIERCQRSFKRLLLNAETIGIRITQISEDISCNDIPKGVRSLVSRLYSTTPLSTSDTVWAAPAILDKPPLVTISRRLLGKNDGRWLPQLLPTPVSLAIDEKDVISNEVGGLLIGPGQKRTGGAKNGYKLGLPCVFANRGVYAYPKDPDNSPCIAWSIHSPNGLVGNYYFASCQELLQNPYFCPSEQELMLTAKAIDLITKHNLTRYNDLLNFRKEQFPLSVKEASIRILVGLGRCTPLRGGSESAEGLIAIAKDTWPDAQILLKAHPFATADVQNSIASFATEQEVSLVPAKVNAPSVIKAVNGVVVHESLLGFEALLLGRKVVCTGLPFYAGWGLTDDYHPEAKRSLQRRLHDLFVAACVRSTRYVDPKTGEEIALLQALEEIASVRRKKSPMVLFEFSNSDAALDALEDVVAVLHETHPELRLVGLDFCTQFGQVTDHRRCKMLFDETIIFNEYLSLELQDNPQKEEMQKNINEVENFLLIKILQELNPNAVVVNNDRAYLEKSLIRVAKEQGYSTVLIQESIRRDKVFKDYYRNKIAHGHTRCDRVLAWGEEGTEYFLSLGLDPNSVRITGSSRLAKFRKDVTLVNTKMIKQAIGLGQSTRVVLLTTSPMPSISELTDEEFIFSIRRCFQVVEYLNNRGSNVRLVFRPHRSEVKSNYYEKAGVASEVERSSSLLLDNKLSITEAIAISDIVLNFSSTVAVEAAIVGRPVGQIQLYPRDYGVDFVQRGLAVELKTAGQIAGFIMNGKVSDSFNQSSIEYYCGNLNTAASNIAAEIEDILQLEGAYKEQITKEEQLELHGQIVLTVNTPHKLEPVHAFWMALASHVREAGGCMVEFTGRDTKPEPQIESFRIKARFESVPELELLNRSSHNCPVWLNENNERLLLEWENKRFGITNWEKARLGLRRLACYADILVQELRPAFILTFNRVDPICDLFHMSAEYHKQTAYLLENAPTNGIWLEFDGMYAQSRLWQEYRPEIADTDFYREIGCRELEKIKSNPGNLRTLTCSNSDLALLQLLRQQEQPVIFFPLDHVLGTRLAQPDHPMCQTDYPFFVSVEDALELVQECTRRLGARMVVKLHPSDTVSENLIPPGVDVYSGDLGSIFQESDVVFTMNTQVAFAALAYDLPVVCAGWNPVAVSGATYFCSSRYSLEGCLRRALKREGLYEKGESYRRFLGWLKSEYFYEHYDDNQANPNRGPERFLNDLLRSKSQINSTQLVLSLEVCKVFQELRQKRSYISDFSVMTSNSKTRILSIQPASSGLLMHPYFGGKDIICHGIATHVKKLGYEYFILPPPRNELWLKEGLYAVGEGNFARVVPNRLYGKDFLRDLSYLSGKPGNQQELALERQEISKFNKYWSDGPQLLRAVYDRYHPSILVNNFPTRNEVNKAISEANLPISTVAVLHSGKLPSYVEAYDCLVFVSDASRRRAISDVPNLNEIAIVIRPDVRQEFMAPLPNSPQRRGFLFIAALREDRLKIKGLDILLDAMDNEQLRNIPLAIIGDGPERVTCEAYAKQLGVVAEFLGSLDAKGIVHCLDNIEWFVMPSRREGFGIVYIEALVRGVPIIGLSEIVEELEACLEMPVGLAFDPNTNKPEDYLAQLLKQARTGDTKVDVSNTGRLRLAKRARECFGSGTTAAAYMQLFRSLSS